MQLDTDQIRAYRQIVAGHNVFVTGPGGSGKSFLIMALIKYFEENRIIYGLTALTGVAASLISGLTLHSWSGIQLGEDPAEVLIGNLLKKPFYVKRWQVTRVLIVDEISMMSAELLDKLNLIAMTLRRNTRPFGGLQVVFCGDFCQLPPVNGEFCFNSASWADLAVQVCPLTSQHRLKSGQDTFQKILNEIRFGIITPEAIDFLSSRVITPEQSSLAQKTTSNSSNLDPNQLTKINPTVLYPHRASVDAVNQGELLKLPGPSKLYIAQDTFYANELAIRRGQSSDIPEQYAGLANFRSPASIEVRVGAQVMLIRNLDIKLGLVNGSRGVVVGLDDYSVTVKWAIGPTPYDILPFIEEPVKYNQMLFVRKMIPLIMAFALTIHKTQGCSLEKVECDLRRAFEYGQVYVALSRVRSLEGLSLLGFNPNKIKCHPDVLSFYNIPNSNTHGDQHQTDDLTNQVHRLDLVNDIKLPSAQ